MGNRQSVLPLNNNISTTTTSTSTSTNNNNNKNRTGKNHNHKSSKKSSSPTSKTFRYIDDRRFHNDENSRYSLPNDDAEIDRLQMAHYLFRHIFQGNFSSPVEDILKAGARVLDAGCGPGTWVMDMATEYPRTQFIGVDLSSMFPTDIKPFNTLFLQANILDGLPFADNEFDYVHLGFLSFAFTEEEWQERVIPEMVRVIKPGGYIEFYEADTVAPKSGPYFNRVLESVRQDLALRGINSRIAMLLEGYLLSNPYLTNVQQLVKQQPLGGWGGRPGMLNEENTLLMFRTLGSRLARLMGITNNEFEMILNIAREEFNEHETFYNFHRVYAQKVLEFK